MSTPEAAEIVADVADEVAEQATHVAEVSRGLSGRDLSLIFGGFVVGAGLSGVLTFIFCNRKLETKYSELAAEEIAEMQEHYNAKAIALENTVDKPALDALIQERGYVPEPEETEPPMAMAPPAAVVQAVEETKEETSSPPSIAESVGNPQVEERNVFRDYEPPPDLEDEWDWHKERASRSPLRPFVIHIEERDENDAYDSVTWTYYEEDDVICNEADDIISGADRERIIGEANLNKFGHGSGDREVVYIRNPQLEMDIELVRSPNSYAREVRDFDPPEPEIRHTARRRFRTTDDE